MTQAQFESYIDNISVFDSMKENLSTLNIDWETDISKIDISVLPGEYPVPYVPGVRQNIIWFPIERIPVNDLPLFIDGDIERFVELYKLIESGVKIIPPMVQRTVHYIEGIAQVDPIPYLITPTDGSHRLRLCKHTGQSKVPILFIETPVSFKFSKANWELKNIGVIIEFTNKQSLEVQRFPLVQIRHFYLTTSGDYWFEPNYKA